jgi:hypothetical protein
VLGAMPRQSHSMLQLPRTCSDVYGNRAMCRALLTAVDSRRWCLAHSPVLRRGLILPRLVTYWRSKGTSLWSMVSALLVQKAHGLFRLNLKVRLGRGLCSRLSAKASLLILHRRLHCSRPGRLLALRPHPPRHRRRALVLLEAQWAPPGWVSPRS